MDELDEILDKEEELYDDLIEPEDKLRNRHPLFLFLAIIALIAIIIFAIDFFLGSYIPWRKTFDKPKPQTSIMFNVNHPRDG
ncbi:hypothetical protein KKB99_01695 [bacterium]|nr:hypothetical protein [bacterium]MBU1024700.1 hypothetical protein [bacterium]